jgi:AcrR family transcriptional regulator
MGTSGSREAYVDPRAARTRRAVLHAAAGIIATDGTAGLTHQRVAERAGVGRATIYRHWPTTADLLYDAMSEVDEPLFRNPGGSLVAWLRRDLRRVAVDIAQPAAVQFVAFLVGRPALDPAAAELRQRLLERSAAVLAVGLRDGLAAGELHSSPDPEDLMACLVGPLLFRVVHEGRRATDRFIDSVIDQALAPYR